MSRQEQPDGTEVKLRVFRGMGNDPSIHRYDTFTVPHQEGMVVLNAIHYIQSHFDSSLSARWNCKAGSCGSCSAEINEVPRLMCKTPVDKFDGEITVEPMKAFPLVRDLVTDVSENWDVAKMIPPFTPKQGLKEPGNSTRRTWSAPGRCGSASSASYARTSATSCREHKADYIGPRWVVKAASFDMHPMDALNRSDFMKDQAGLGYCNITKCCQEICPEHIIITDDAIIPEKERVVDRHYDPLVWVYRKLRGSK